MEVEVGWLWVMLAAVMVGPPFVAAVWRRSNHTFTERTWIAWFGLSIGLIIGFSAAVLFFPGGGLL